MCNLLLYLKYDNLEEAVKSDIILWKNSLINNSQLDNILTSNGKSTEYFSNIEKSFSNKDGELPSSVLLDIVINGREELLKSYPNGTLAWLLANDYQNYALNYLYQSNKDGNSILFLYLKSINNTRISLSFDISQQTKKDRIEYLKMRYKDIGDCKILDDNIRLRAYDIVTAIDKVLEELD